MVQLSPFNVSLFLHLTPGTHSILNRHSLIDVCMCVCVCINSFSQNLTMIPHIINQFTMKFTH
jgi:NADH:ubiquinone oxidoreductase subunit K